MSGSATASTVSCQACGESIARPDEAGFDCECGVFVCREDVCFDEYFKTVGGGEAVRCRTCGHLT
jgi:hypothetical protein